MEEDYIEWDGTEECLYSLLDWWLSRDFKGYEHIVNKYGINSGTAGLNYRLFSSLEFVNFDGTKTLIEPGGRIYYDGKGIYRAVA